MEQLTITFQAELPLEGGYRCMNRLVFWRSKLHIDNRTSLCAEVATTSAYLDFGLLWFQSRPFLPWTSPYCRNFVSHCPTEPALKESDLMRFWSWLLPSSTRQPCVAPTHVSPQLPKHVPGIESLFFVSPDVCSGKYFAFEFYAITAAHLGLAAFEAVSSAKTVETQSFFLDESWLVLET